MRLFTIFKSTAGLDKIELSSVLVMDEQTELKKTAETSRMPWSNNLKISFHTNMLMMVMEVIALYQITIDNVEKLDLQNNLFSWGQYILQHILDGSTG